MNFFPVISVVHSTGIDDDGDDDDDNDVIGRPTIDGIFILFFLTRKIIFANRN